MRRSKNRKISWEGKNRKKESQLGMPIGTAASRLRKLVLFEVLKRHAENFCFQCGLEITSATDLSIEHKHPWLDIDVDLFWDMDNIAFSHQWCNFGAARNIWKRGPSRLRKIGSKGTAWCRAHQEFLPVGAFSKNCSNWNGLQGECDECRSKRRNASYRKKRDGEAQGNPTLFTGLEDQGTSNIPAPQN